MTSGEIILLTVQLIIGGILLWWLRVLRSTWAATKDLMQQEIELLRAQMPAAQDLAAKVKIFEKYAEAKVQKLQEQMREADEEHRQEIEQEHQQTIALQDLLNKILSYLADVQQREILRQAALKRGLGLEDDHG